MEDKYIEGEVMDKASQEELSKLVKERDYETHV